jgi:squalene synthase HpnD
MNDAAPNISAADRVRGSSFYAAMRIMPRIQREAMYEIYAFCRNVDDVADGGEPAERRRLELARWRWDVMALFDGHPPTRLAGLAKPVAHFGLKREDFLTVIDGMEMDAAEDIRAPDMAKLDLYCERVASAVGRLSVRVFGMAEAEGTALAHHLGRALQLTNILRDLDEDGRTGRLYLPREALLAAGIAETQPTEVLAHRHLGQACETVVARARGHFAQAHAIMKSAPRQTVRTPLIMYEAYQSILDRLVRRGWEPPRERVRVGKLRLVGILLQVGLF